MVLRRTLLFLASMAASAALWAQSTPTIRKVPLKSTSPISGKEMFAEYCASCHGLDGKGSGPAARALKKVPSDLTKLTAHNDGKFPDTRVFSFIQGDEAVSAHGSRDMPVWGTLFRDLNSDSSMVQMRISNLTGYLKSIQAK